MIIMFERIKVKGGLVYVKFMENEINYIKIQETYCCSYTFNCKFTLEKHLFNLNNILFLLSLLKPLFFT